MNGKLYGNHILPTNSLANLLKIPKDNSLYYKELSTNSSIGLNEDLEEGLEISVIIKNTGSANITITLPSSEKFINLDASTISIQPQKYMETSILCFRNTTNSPCYILSSKS